MTGWPVLSSITAKQGTFRYPGIPLIIMTINFGKMLNLNVEMRLGIYIGIYVKGTEASKCY